MELPLTFDADLGPETLFTLSLALASDTFYVSNCLKQSLVCQSKQSETMLPSLVQVRPLVCTE